MKGKSGWIPLHHVSYLRRHTLLDRSAKAAPDHPPLARLCAFVKLRNGNSGIKSVARNPGTLVDVTDVPALRQGVSDGFFRALLSYPHRRGILGRDRYRDLDVDALSSFSGAGPHSGVRGRNAHQRPSQSHGEATGSIRDAR
jgi:hypothetical protein